MLSRTLLCCFVFLSILLLMFVFIMHVRVDHLNVSDAHVSLHVVADHKVSQDAAGGDLGLLDDVGAEGDLADVLFILDHSGHGRLELG